MTECNRKSLSFTSLGRQEIVADFDGSRLTSDSEAPLLREVDRRLGLTSGMAECIAHPRDPAKITHGLRTLLTQRVFGIALVYEDLNDHETLRSDPLFAILAEQRPDPDAPLETAALVRYLCPACLMVIPRVPYNITHVIQHR